MVVSDGRLGLRSMLALFAHAAPRFAYFGSGREHELACQMDLENAYATCMCTRDAYRRRLITLLQR